MRQPKQVGHHQNMSWPTHSPPPPTLNRPPTPGGGAPGPGAEMGAGPAALRGARPRSVGILFCLGCSTIVTEGTRREGYWVALCGSSGAATRAAGEWRGASGGGPRSHGGRGVVRQGPEPPTGVVQLVEVAVWHKGGPRGGGPARGCRRDWVCVEPKDPGTGPLGTPGPGPIGAPPPRAPERSAVPPPTRGGRYWRNRRADHGCTA